MDKMMRVYRCDASPDGVLTAVYDAGKSGYGHKYIRIVPSDSPAYDDIELFTEYIDVRTDTAKSESVMRSMANISYKALMYVMRSADSFEPTRGDAIYAFVVAAFAVGRGIGEALQLPAVKEVFELSRKVERESHYFLEFIRFREIKEDPPVLLATIEPKCRVLPYVMRHFTDRFRTENFVIFDKTHREAAFHEKNSEYYIRLLTDEEAKELDSLRERDMDYVDLWKTFFDHIMIESRSNPRCQRNLLPVWYRKNLTEFITDKENG